MNSAPFVQLVWKEYRAARAFWLSLIVLVIAAQALTFWASDDAAWNVRMICNLALAAPAFFALGCAGAAFAVEQEEGTFEFLQAVPVSPRQVLASKLGLAATATLAMFLLLWPAALAFTGGALPEPKVFSGMLGLWLLAAVEALAWGTLFSLLSARPLMAIGLALVATSTVVHLSAWSTLGPGAHEFSFAPYLHAVPLRALIVAAVLAADVYLGLQWLRGGAAGSLRATLTSRDAESAAPIQAAADATVVKTLGARQDRGAMLTHLLWHHWRQSGRLMLLMATLQIGAVALVLASGVPDDDSAILPLFLIAGLAGSCVFRPDHQRRHYRFFVEHNIPPRLVWVTRQIPWIAVLFVSTTITCVAWIGLSAIVKLAALVNSATSIEVYYSWNQIRYIQVPELLFGLACVAVAYAAGQWASMMIRSGLLAGFFGLLLAGALCRWVYLMYQLQVSWLWTVLPIPLLLLWATWLRAPDWVRENTGWAARLRAGAVVVVPTLALLIAVPVYRVRSVPFVELDFNLAEYQAGVSPGSLATGEIYRRANELYVYAPADVIHPEKSEESNDAPDRAPTPGQLQWLDENAESLALMLEASRRPTCCLFDPAKMTDRPGLRNGSSLIWLVIISGRQLEAEGKLDEAADRYFAAFRIISHWNEHAPFEPYWQNEHEASRVFSELVDWSVQGGQTAERVRTAFERLRGVDWQILHLADAVKSHYILARRFVGGDLTAGFALFGYTEAPTAQLFWDRLMPWERRREVRRLNFVTNRALSRLNLLETRLRAGDGIESQLVQRVSSEREFPPYYAARRIMVWETAAEEQLALFETNRRAALLRMALVGYRLEHGRLPATLEQLLDGWFKQLPHDPYSGLDFVYFLDGIPPPQTALEAYELKKDSNIVPGVPCVWCTSERLRAVDFSEDDDAQAPSRRFVYYVFRGPYAWPSQLPIYTSWREGHWFPIPEQQE